MIYIAQVNDLVAHGLGVHLLPKLVVTMTQHSMHDPAKLVACGQNFTIVVTASGKPWAWGEGRCGELGIGECIAAQRTPVRVCWPEGAAPCSSIACGWAHVLATDINAVLYA